VGVQKARLAHPVVVEGESDKRALLRVSAITPKFPFVKYPVVWFL
jgi:hypothetical protein